MQGLDALERRSAEVVHDHEHRARRPVIPDVVGAEALVDVGRTLSSDDAAATPAPRLFVVVHLGAEQGLANDVDDDLLPVAVHLGEPARLAQRADHAERQHVEEVLRLAIGAGAISAVPLGVLGLLRVALVDIAIAPDGGLGLVAACRVRAGRRRAPRRLAGRARCVVEARPRRVLRRGGGCCDLGDHALVPLLGACDLLPDQGVDEGPVVELELSLADPVAELTEFVQRELEPLRRRADFPTRLPRPRSR